MGRNDRTDGRAGRTNGRAEDRARTAHPAASDNQAGHERYFERIEAELERALAVANTAREAGGDPVSEVEIPVAQDMADRVENILGIDGVAARVRELEGDRSREEAALALTEDFVAGDVGDYETAAGKIEGAVRTAVALLTEGVVAAPIEGIDRVEIREDDGTEFVSVEYAGPIRSAGGTAQALSVLVADYARSLLGIGAYQACEPEIGRYAEEVALYDDETGLQYAPSEAEARFIAEHLPIMLDGEPTSDGDVEGYRDLERVSTNAARGGMCLVFGEGIALKAPKIQRYTRELSAVAWPWLQTLIDGDYAAAHGTGNDSDTDNSSGNGDGDGDSDSDGNSNADAETDTDADNHTHADGSPKTAAVPDPGSAAAAVDDATGSPPRPEPTDKFLTDLIAGRPVFSHPSEPGGFRLRYGRARNHGHATAGVSPATMHLVDDFLAPGTQLKTERPGKAAGVVPVDTIEGPTVRLATGEVRRIDDAAEALELRNGVERVLDLGEYLVNYGEFVENNHDLAPAGYTVEWWRQELAAAGAPVRALQDASEIDLADPIPERALAWADADVPLHPAYTYLWHDISVEQAIELAAAVADGRLDNDRLVLDRTEPVRETLETLLVEHTQGEQLSIPEWRPLVRSLGVSEELDRPWQRSALDRSALEYEAGDNAIRLINQVAPFTVRERAPTRVGARMGRPEKSEQRELSPAVHCLFPLDAAGGNQRSVEAAADHGDELDGTKGIIETELARRSCPACDTQTHWGRCPACGAVTEPVYRCPDCDRVVSPDEAGRAECPACSRPAEPTAQTTVDVGDALGTALSTVSERTASYDILKGVKGLTSAEKIPEPLEKGILRAKRGVSAFKDGTVRYDMTDLPVTAVRPAELDVTTADLRELGYRTDVHGEALRHDDQLVELRVQDVVLPDGAAEHLLKTADFVDDLLEQYYGLEPYYEFEDREDLLGELVFGMAPHTSAATVGRVVGFTAAAVGYAHPYFHAAKRRNCFHPETTLWYTDETGDWRHERIETLVEARLTEPRTDDVGTLIQELEADLRVPSVDETGDTVLKPIAAVSKHPAPDHLVRVRTQSGRQLTVTPDHQMLRVTGEGLERTEAHSLAPGDRLPPRLGWGASPGRPDGATLAADGGDTDTTAATDADTAVGAAHADPDSVPTPDSAFAFDAGSAAPELVDQVQFVPADVENTYCLTVEDTHTLYANGLPVGQCDGDEDCVMLLMDGLLNFSKKYLPDQRGGSVGADSRLVAVDPEGEVRFLSFAAFWERLDSPVIQDGKFQKKLCRSAGWQTYAFDAEHNAVLRPIERAIRYPAGEADTVLQVETQSGRSLTITANHSLFRYDDGIEDVAGDELSEGDLVLAPQQLDIDTAATTLDLDVSELVDDPRVLIDDRVADLLATARASADRDLGHPDRGVPAARHARWTQAEAGERRGDTIAYERLERLLNAGCLAGVPADVTITTGREAAEAGINRTVSLTEEVAWLLGLFVAAGSLSGRSPTIHSADPAVVDRAADIVAAQFGHDPNVRATDPPLELRLPVVFQDLLSGLGGVDADAGAASSDRADLAVPEPVLRAPCAIVSAFLRGVRAGNKRNESSESDTDDSADTIAVQTRSEDATDGIVFLLHRLGLVASVSEEPPGPGDRQDSGRYAATVTATRTTPDGADTSLCQADGDNWCQPDNHSRAVPTPEALLELRGMGLDSVENALSEHSLDPEESDGSEDCGDSGLKNSPAPETVSLATIRAIVTALEDCELPEHARTQLAELRPLVAGDLSYLRVASIEEVAYEGQLYDLQVGGEPVFTANWLYAHNSMDAPLVMSSRIDPTEIDDEAHNIDTMQQYPRAFYEATREQTAPSDLDVEMETIADSLGTDRQYDAFAHTHDTADIAAGPALSAYKTLGDMQEKMNAQLALSRRLRAVDETDVAERIIESHFLPDLLGNLKAFASQEFRCRDCSTSYRRAPLTGDCPACGGEVSLTVYEGAVTKYMDTALRVAEEFGCRPYTKQRLEILEQRIERVFEDDTNKPASLGDFM